MNTYMAMWDKVVDKYVGEYGPLFNKFDRDKGMKEVTLIGRAGEGVWVTGELLGAAAIEKGKYSKVLFSMPSERRNSPTRSFVRIADKPVTFPVSWIHSADDVILLEEDLLDFYSPVLDFEVEVVTRRMKPNGNCYVNSPKRPSELKAEVTGRLVTLDATKISVKYLGSPFFMNIAMLGAYVAVSKAFSLEDIEQGIRNFINPRGHRIFEKELGDKNIQALRAGYNNVVI